jgi:hypothetical protein
MNLVNGEPKCVMCGRYGAHFCIGDRTQTNADLIELIKKSVEHMMTRDEILEQKISFIYGQVKGVSKQQIRAILEKAGQI